MKKYIDEHLGKCFIRLNLSVTVALVQLVKKPGGGLRFCVNYRAFNKIIIKNWYPILLINKMLEKLANATRFTKLDIIYAFKRI